jgi:hypothetical protein
MLACETENPGFAFSFGGEDNTVNAKAQSLVQCGATSSEKTILFAAA